MRRRARWRCWSARNRTRGCGWRCTTHHSRREAAWLVRSGGWGDRRRRRYDSAGRSWRGRGGGSGSRSGWRGCGAFSRCRQRRCSGGGDCGERTGANWRRSIRSRRTDRCNNAGRRFGGRIGAGALLLLGLRRCSALLGLGHIHLCCRLDGGAARGRREPFSDRQRQAHRHRRRGAADAVDLFGLALLDNVLAGHANLFGDLADADLGSLDGAQAFLFSLDSV